MLTAVPKKKATMMVGTRMPDVLCAKLVKKLPVPFLPEQQCERELRSDGAFCLYDSPGLQ
jgi:hypothetical protein